MPAHVRNHTNQKIEYLRQKRVTSVYIVKSGSNARVVMLRMLPAPPMTANPIETRDYEPTRASAKRLSRVMRRWSHAPTITVTPHQLNIFYPVRH